MSEAPEGQQSERDALRSIALGAPSVPSGKLIEYKGGKFEFRRATLSQQQRIDKLAKNPKTGEIDQYRKLVLTFIDCVYVPGSKEKVFKPHDEAVLMEMDSAPDGLFAAFVKALAELADEEAAVEKNSETAPTDS